MPDLTEEELQAAAQAEAAGIPGYEQVAGVPVPMPTEPVTLPAQPGAAPAYQGPSALEAGMAPIQAAGGLEALLAPRAYGPSTQVRTTTTDRTTVPLNPEAVAAANAQARASQDAANEEAMQLAIVQGRPYMYGGQALDQMAENRAAAQQQADAQQAEIFEREANVQRQVSGLLDQARSPVVRGALFEGPGGGGRAISMGIGMLFSGLRGLATGNPNAALEFVNNVVERNLQDQIRERDNAYQNAEARNSLFSMAERELGSREAATAVTRAAMYDYAIEKMRARISANTPKELQLQVEAQIAALEAQRDQAVAQGVAQSATRTTERQIRQLPGGVRRPRISEVVALTNALGGNVGRDQGQAIAERRYGGTGQAASPEIAHGTLGPLAATSPALRTEVANRVTALESFGQAVNRLGSLSDRWESLGANARLTAEGREIIREADMIRGTLVGLANSGILKFGAMNAAEFEIANALGPDVTSALTNTRTVRRSIDRLQDMVDETYTAMERGGLFQPQTPRAATRYGTTSTRADAARASTSVPVIPE
jgi:hypothetical protein